MINVLKDNRLVEMRVFKAVAETGGFTTAANRLSVSQPYVSQKVTDLENRLGVLLLRRSTRTQRLTAEGEQFLDVCNVLLNQLESAETQLKTTQPSGLLRISAPLSFGSDQIVPHLPGFLNSYPDIELQLSLSDSLANLIEDNIDVAIRMGRLQDSSLASRKLCDLHRIIVASPDYIKQHGSPTRPQDLEQHECLSWHGPQDHLNRWPFLVDGKREEFIANGRYASMTGTALFQLCIAGMGVMRCAEHIAIPALRSGQLVALLTPYQAYDDNAIHAVFLPERQLIPRIRVFIDYFQAFFHTPPWASS